jgi:tRNA pseudouridine55 synthase
MENQITPKIFNIYKPIGMTSGDVVHHFKKNLLRPFGKIGHFGTLDPFAEGVLLIGVGGSCRLSDYAHEFLPKTYLAKGLVGSKMTTGDRDGQLLEKKPWEHLTQKNNDEFQNIFNQFLGDYKQTPPAFSATKHKGKALYKWARDGVIINKPPVKRKIHTIEFISLNGQELTFRVTVSTGTYIRTLFEDLTEKLGTVGHLIVLKRESVGPISSNDGLLKENWPIKEVDQSNIHYYEMSELLPFQSTTLTRDQEIRYGNGIAQSLIEVEKIIRPPNSLELTHYLADKPFLWVYGASNNLIGLGEIVDNTVKTCFNLPKNHYKRLKSL